MNKNLLPILEEFNDDVEKLCAEIEILRDRESDMQKMIDELRAKIDDLELERNDSQIELNEKK